VRVHRRLIPRLLLLAVLASAAAAALAAETAAEPAAGAPPRRLRVGLVLSGGGARGAAHIGVLKVLEELHVPVDAIAGTSMGAVVGSLYASGMPADEVESVIGSIDWQDAFRDRPPRRALNFRRKQDDREFLVHAPIGLRGGRLQLPRGLIQGQKLNQMLRLGLLPVAEVADFDRLPIRFRALATDLSTGEPVVFRSGSLATAVRASLAAPGVFAPVEVDGRQLVDGGLVDNLPVGLIREMDVDVVIAVDVSAPLRPAGELDSALSVSNQMISILMNRATARSRALLTPRDVLIVPDLGELSSVDFAQVHEAIAAGMRAARDGRDRLAALAASPDDYARFLARRPGAPVPPTIDFVRVAPGSGGFHKFIEASLAPLVGGPATAAAIGPATEALYGRDLFESLDYDLVRDGSRRGLEVAARPRSWGPNYLRFALDLQDDFQGGASYTAGVRFLVTEVNPYMAEWNVDIKVGDRPEFGAEFHQPLGYASPWFVAPRFKVDSRSVQVRDADRLVAEYRVRETDLGLDFGRELGNWGEARVGVQRLNGSTHLRVGLPTPDQPDTAYYHQGGLYARLSVDRLDSVNFPRRGELFVLQWDGQRVGLGADRDADTAQFDWLLARSRERNTLVFRVSGGSTLTTTSGVQNYFPLGGFLNLSGVPAGALSGPHFGIARLIYLHRIGRSGEGLFDVPTYLGLSAEAGNVWQRRSDISFASARKDGAAFVGFDTPLGPVYIGVGYDQLGSTSYYLSLGRTF
jgi:NTE family protein